MQTLSNDSGCVTAAVRKTATVLLLTLLLTAATIVICPRSFAQEEKLTGPFNEMVLTEPDRSTETPRRVFVRSTALLVRAAVVEDKLLKRSEFKQLGFVITRAESDADLILELRHDLLTKYVFSVVEVRTHTVLISGKVSSLGGTVAGKVAKRFVRDMARTP
jgi:hypothetical protein